MEDLCLQTADQAEFDSLLLLTGLGVEAQDGEGNTVVAPASDDVALDRIGPIVMNGVRHPGYHANLLVGFPLSDEQRAAMAPFLVNPKGARYRVWLS